MGSDTQADADLARHLLAQERADDDLDKFGPEARGIIMRRLFRAKAPRRESDVFVLLDAFFDNPPKWLDTRALAAAVCGYNDAELGSVVRVALLNCAEHVASQETDEFYTLLEEIGEREKNGESS